MSGKSRNLLSKIEQRNTFDDYVIAWGVNVSENSATESVKATVVSVNRLPVLEVIEVDGSFGLAWIGDGYVG